MTIKYLKKSPKTSSTDDTKTTEIVKSLLKDIEINKEQAIKGRVSVQLFSALKEDGIKEVRKLLANWLFL